MMGEMVVCLGCRTVVWAYDHEPQDVRAIANHLQLPCPNCCEIGNFDGWQSSDWQEMHAIADREGFVWQPDGECRWFGATSVVKAMKEETEAASAVEVTQLEMQHHGCGGHFRLDDANQPIVRCNRCGERRQITGIWVMTKEVE